MTADDRADDVTDPEPQWEAGPAAADVDAGPVGGTSSATEAAGPAGDQGTGTPAGWGIVRVDLWATAVFTVVSVTAAAWSGMVGVALAVDGVLFVVGCVVFAGAFLRAVGRSRDEAISLGGLFFLAGGVAPAVVARWLWGALAAQVVVAVATAAVRPFSSLAFGVLAPMFGMAILALWGARYGRFPPRVAPGPQPARRRSSSPRTSQGQST